jgi:hypothetical protein
VREFAKAQFKLAQAPPPLRWIYAGFLLLIAAGFSTQLAFQIGRIGFSPSAVATYYRGSDAGDVMAFPKNFGQLVEVTHAHAFVFAIVFLILAHLFAATSVSDRVKVIVLALAFVGTVGDLVAPWLVRYGAAWCAWLALFAWSAQGLGNFALVVISGWECVTGHPARGGCTIR